MQSNDDVSRRRFLQIAGAASSTAYLRLSGAVLAAVTQAACTAKNEASPFKILQADEARDFIAIAARIIPTTDTPGATEAAVIHFFDNAFAEWQQDDLESARQGLAEFNTALSESGHAGRFDELVEDQQDEFLRSQESGAFFAMLREMTIFGFFAMSSYGGNKDHVSWDLIGFKGHQGGWTYPFGHYDAEYVQERTDAE
ncbi:MAG: gluconate 2-dehydrogenase subunit 3 family protein [Woeseiaceae bacterium]